VSDKLVQWQRFVGGLGPDDALRSVILESWERSRAFGVDPTPARAEPRRVSGEELALRLASSAELIETSRPHLEWLSAALHELRHVAYIVDRDGIVLVSTGNDPDSLRSLGLTPGYDWSETMMGTNGAGTALASGEPVSIKGAEHFAAPFHGFWCTGAPIRGAGGEIVGALDISTPVEDGSRERLLAVAHAAYTIGQELAYRSSLRRTGRELATERELAEALRESETRLRALMSANILGVAIADEQGVREANDEFLRVSGTTRAAFEARGVNWRAITPPEYHEPDGRALQEVIDHGACTPFEKEYVWPDGTRVPILVGAARLTQQPVSWIAFALDLTKRKRAETRVRLLQELTAALGSALTSTEIADVVVSRLLAALGADGGSLVVLDPGGDSCRIVRGMSYAAATNRDWVDRPIPLSEMLPATDALRSGQAVELASLDAWRARYPGLDPFFGDSGFEALTVLPCSLDGRVLGAVCLRFREPRVLTEEEHAFALALAQQCAHALDRARLYEAEHKARSEAEAASRAKSEFLSLVSHELRTPLNAIAGYAQLMQMGIPDTPTAAQEDYLARIQTAQQHLLSLVNDVLSLARIESGHLDYHVAGVTVRELFTGVEALVAPQLLAKGLDYRIAPCDPQLSVRADREKALQVLVNLVGNAIKFTEPGGSIGLDVEEREAAVALRVRDTGVGITPEKLATIFEPFVQVDTSLTRTADGVGLGLAISRALAAGMGGDLSAESTPGEGSVFTLTLPR
jgi:PAS domain S-box-containing protein